MRFFLALARIHFMFFIILQTGQLNEYTERREMPADVVCMSLGAVPVGEQRCRFLAVGLADSTVRVISLDPSVSYFGFGSGKFALNSLFGNDVKILNIIRYYDC